MRIFRLFLGALVFASTRAALASERSVCVDSSSNDPLVAQTMHRIGGELGAAGFEVSFPRVGEVAPCDAGRISLEVVNSSHLAIVAKSGDEETKVVAALELDAAHRRAEMFAVRAVEALRAAMLQRVRLHPDEPVAEPLRAFTRDLSAKGSGDLASEGTPRAANEASVPNASSAPRSVPGPDVPARILFGIGPRLGLDAAESSFLLAADFAVLWGPFWIGARGDFRPLGIRYEGRAGSIDVTSYAFGASLGVRVVERKRFAIYGGAKLDYRLVEMRAIAPNGATTWVRHRTADPGAFVWGAYFFSERSGIALAIDGGFSVSSPEIHYDERVVSFGRPSFSLGPELFFEF